MIVALPLAVVTTTSTVPVPEGVTAVKLVSPVTFIPVQAEPPIVTPVTNAVLTKLLPAIVTVVPPLEIP